MLIYFQRPLLPLNLCLTPALKELLHYSYRFVSFSLAEEINYDVRFKDKTWSSDLRNPDSLLYRKFEEEIQELVILNVAFVFNDLRLNTIKINYRI